MRYALSGKIKCFHDGATFIKGSYKNKRTGYESKYWGCSNYRKKKKKKVNGCKTPIIHYQELLNQILHLQQVSNDILYSLQHFDRK